MSLYRLYPENLSRRSIRSVKGYNVMLTVLICSLQINLRRRRRKFAPLPSFPRSQFQSHLEAVKRNSCFPGCRARSPIVLPTLMIRLTFAHKKDKNLIVYIWDHWPKGRPRFFRFPIAFRNI